MQVKLIHKGTTSVYTSVWMVRPCKDKLFLYWHPGTTKYKHYKTWDYEVVEYNSYYDTLEIKEMPAVAVSGHI